LLGDIHETRLKEFHQFGAKIAQHEQGVHFQITYCQLKNPRNEKPPVKTWAAELNLSTPDNQGAEQHVNKSMGRRAAQAYKKAPRLGRSRIETALEGEGTGTRRPLPNCWNQQYAAG